MLYPKRSGATPFGQVVVSFTSSTVYPLRLSPRTRCDNTAWCLQCSSARYTRARDFGEADDLQSSHWTKIKAPKQQVLESEISLFVRIWGIFHSSSSVTFVWSPACINDMMWVWGGVQCQLEQKREKQVAKFLCPSVVHSTSWFNPQWHVIVLQF